jgi:hypothetical protein
MGYSCQTLRNVIEPTAGVREEPLSRKKCFPGGALINDASENLAEGSRDPALEPLCGALGGDGKHRAG